MRTIKSTRFGISRNILLTLAIAALLVAPAMFIGCQNSDNSDTLGVASSSDVAGDVEPLTMTAVSAKVSLSGDQQIQLEKVLQTYNREREVRRAARANANRRAGLAAGAGSPMTTLLRDCADFLDTEQMTALATAISEQRASAFKNRTNRAGGHGQGVHRGDNGPGFGGRMLDSLTSQLDLTDDQVQAFKARFESMREEFPMGQRGAQRQGRPSFDDGNRGSDFHQKMRDELATILTGEQMQKLDEMHEARRSERQNQRQEFAEERLDNRADFMIRVLKLDESQAAQLKTILASAEEKRQQLHDNIANGTVDREKIREQMPHLGEQTESEIRDLLTDEQVALFDALKDLLPHGARRGPRPL